jgi:hypothetical protein
MKHHQNEQAKPQAGLEQARADQRAATRVMVGERRRQNDETRKVLDTLRKTRSQRDVGTLQVPKHLQTPIGYSEQQLRKQTAERVIIDPRTGMPFD